MSKLDSEIHAVFTIKPVKNTSTAVIKCAGHIKNEDDKKSLGDEPLVCNENVKDPKDESKYIFPITDIVYARFYKCYIIDTYLMAHKSLPVMYASIMYQNQIVGGLLLNIFIEFIIEDENIKSEKQLVGNKLNGKFMITIKKDDKNNTEEPKTIELDNYTTDAITIETLKSIMMTEEMKEVIDELLEKRRLERIEKFGSFNGEDFEISKPKYNFNKLVKEYIKKSN